MHFEQRETLAVIEIAIYIDGLDLGVKAVEDSKKLNENAAGGVAVLYAAHRQRVSILFITRAQSLHRLKRSCSTLGFRLIGTVCTGFIAVVRTQVGVC